MGEGDLAVYKSVAAELGAWICFTDESGQSLRPPKARTWSRRGRTPVVKVAGKGSGRVHLAGLIATRPGTRTRPIFRLPSYAPELNPVEGVWSHCKRSIANLAPRGTEQLATLIGSRLRYLQYRPHLLDGIVTETGLLINATPP